MSDASTREMDSGHDPKSEYVGTTHWVSISSVACYTMSPAVPSPLDRKISANKDTY
ncbi:hypothetical protein HYDPIDRAFT_117281, partial [Hydnomerulius pinastri MD-312]